MNKPAEHTRMDEICATILTDGFKRKIAAELQGKGVDHSRFTLTAVTALRTNPDLFDCNAKSLYNAVQRAAHDGLLPDGREGAIVYFWNKETKEKHAQWMPMIWGIVKKLGKYRYYCDTQIVHENDEFLQEFGDNPKIVHKPPKLGQDRGKAVGVYAIIKLPDGHMYREVMDVETVESIKSMSKNANGLMWGKFWTEGWRKSCLRRLTKRVPMPEDVRGVIESEDLDINLEDEPKPTDVKPKLIEQIPARTLETVMGAQPEPVAAEPQGEVIDAGAQETGDL